MPRLFALAPVWAALAACYTPYVPPGQTDDTAETGTVDSGCGAQSDVPGHDTDGDLLDDAGEIARGTDPCVRDSDGDGLSDGVEVQLGSDPTNPVSKPEGQFAELPLDAEVALSFEFPLDVRRGDIAILIDTTGSMTPTINAVKAEFTNIVADLGPTLPDAAYGVATFDDYPYGGFGEASRGDLPFILRQQLTTDLPRVQTALNNAVQLHYGADEPESTMEAIYQAATGRGFDQGCDGVYNPQQDVLPFRSDPSDIFGGTSPGASDPSTPGGGGLGGMGFRRGALPILVYATDATLRDPDRGHGVPPACSQPAGGSVVGAALGQMGARVVGVGVNASAATLQQMTDLANATGSVGDLDGNGTSEPLVVSWNNSGSASFRQAVTNAVRSLIGAITFREVSLVPDGPGAAFVASIAPPRYDNVEVATSPPLTFTVTFRGVVSATPQDQVFQVNLKLIAEGSLELGYQTVTLVVPGTGQ